MSTFKVTAPEGVKAKVLIQKQEEHVNVIREVKNSAGDLLQPERTEKFQSWVSVSSDSFATESREYTLNKGERLILEEG